MHSHAAIALSLLCVGCGAIERPCLSTDLDHLTGLAERHLDTTNHLEHVGHRAGSHLEYVTNIHELDAATYLDVVDLMHIAFDKYELDGIEIDVQLDPRGRVAGPVVVHDPIERRDLDQAQLDYLHTNTLERVVRHFARQPMGATHTLFIELKIPWHGNHPKHPPLTPEDAELVHQTVATLDRVFAELEGQVRHEDRFSRLRLLRARKNIALVSFNLHALREARRHRAHPYRTYFIASYDFWYLRRSPNLLGIPPWTAWLRAELGRARYLTGVWFGPIGIGDFDELFDSVARRRAMAGLPELEHYMETYFLSRSRLASALEETDNDDRRWKLHGLIHEIDYSDRPVGSCQ